MRQSIRCSDPEVGVLLHAYELHILSCADVERFELHLMGCERCVREAVLLGDEMAMVRMDPVLRRLTSESSRPAVVRERVLSGLLGRLETTLKSTWRCLEVIARRD